MAGDSVKSWVLSWLYKEDDHPKALSVKQARSHCPYIKTKAPFPKLFKMKTIIAAFLVCVSLTMVIAENCHFCFYDEIGIEPFVSNPKNNSKCLDEFASLQEKDYLCERKHVCVKRLIVNKDDKKFVERGCMTKEDVFEVTYEKSSSLTDECGSGWAFGIERSFCVCQGEKCNGSNSVMASMTFIVLAAMVSKLVL